MRIFTVERVCTDRPKVDNPLTLIHVETLPNGRAAVIESLPWMDGHIQEVGEYDSLQSALDAARRSLEWCLDNGAACEGISFGDEAASLLGLSSGVPCLLVA